MKINTLEASHHLSSSFIQQLTKAITRPDWSALHVFRFGVTQLVSDSFEVKCNTSELLTLGALVDHLIGVSQSEPSQFIINEDSIDVFFGHQIKLKFKDRTQKIIKWGDVDNDILKKVIDEILAIKATAVENGKPDMPNIDNLFPFDVDSNTETTN